VERAEALLRKDASELRLVVAHLGSGCSATAVQGRRSVSTSMGFTPLEGLMMGTRSGSLDPGILIHLLRSGRIGLDELAEVLEHRSGLLGVSGSSASVPELEAAAGRGDEQARLAIDLFIARAAAGIAAAATALQRLDAVVFTGGIGEHAGSVRAAIVDRLACLGLDPIGADESNEDRVLAGRPGSNAAAAGGPKVLRVEAREDLVIARDVARVVATS
jgi:acetate kinase